MKKLWIVSLLLLFLLTGCSTRITDKGTENPGVKVEKETVYLLYDTTITYSDGKEVEIHCLWNDKLKIEGLPVNEAEYYENEKLLGKEIYTYDENENVVSIVQDWAGGSTKTFEYVYDDANRIIEKKEFVNEKFQSHVKISYGSDGKEEKRTVLDESGKEIATLDYEYGDSSTCVVKEYDAQGKLLGYKEQTYSFSGQMAREKVFDAKGELVVTTIWNYVPHTNTTYIIE